MQETSNTSTTASLRRVEVSMTLDIDVNAWAMEYGLDPADIDGDVENHAINTVIEHFRSVGVFA